MAITWKEYNEETKKPEVKGVEYEGLVVKTTWESAWHCSIRVAVIYDPETDMVKNVPYRWDDMDYGTSGYLNEVIVDASEEVMRGYLDHMERERRHNEAVKRWQYHNDLVFMAHNMNLSLKDTKTLINIYEKGSVEMDSVYTLLKTKKFRNEFREKLANQVREWLASTIRKFPSPLSPRQLECIRPFNAWRRY